MKRERYKIYEEDKHVGYFKVARLSDKEVQFSADLLSPTKSFVLFADANGHVSARGIELWLTDRVVPKNRHGIRKLLREMGLRKYDVLDILKYNSARHAGDTCWIDFTAQC